MTSNSVDGLRDLHFELYRKTREGTTPEVLMEVRNFINDCRNAGRSVSDLTDREYLRSLLLRWGEFMAQHSEAAEYLDLSLLPFEGKVVEEEVFPLWQRVPVRAWGAAVGGGLAVILIAVAIYFGRGPVGAWLAPPTATPAPVVVRTMTPTATSTSTPTFIVVIPTPTPTGTLIPTDTPSPTDTPTSTPYPTPALVGPDEGTSFPEGQDVKLAWEERDLAENEFFEVRIRLRGEQKFDQIYLTKMPYEFVLASELTQAGTYEWQVAIVSLSGEEKGVSQIRSFVVQ